MHMRDQQTHQSTETDTERTAESTMNQSQQAMEQLIDLQRNMARMTLSALEWQETAQRQGLEMTRSMLASAPGPQFTESMVESYLQGMEAVMPEMEQVMERGMQAAAQPQMNQMEQMGSQMQGMGAQMSGQARSAEQGLSQRGQHSGMGGQQIGSNQPASQQTGGQQTGGQQPSGQEMRTQGTTQPHPQGTTIQPQPQRTGTQPQPQLQSHAQTSGQQGQGGRSQTHQSQQPRESQQTGEWVSPDEYGGESAGATGSEQRPMTAAPAHSRGDEAKQFGQQSHQSGRQSQQGSADRPQQGSQRPSRGQFEQGHQQGRQTQPQGAQPQSGPQRGSSQQGGPSRSGDRSRPGREYDQPTDRTQSAPGQTDQGRLRDQYSQRIDTDRREGGEPNRSATRGSQQRGGQSSAQGTQRHESEGTDRDRARGETGPPERRAMEETDITSEQPQPNESGRSDEERPNQE